MNFEKTESNLSKILHTFTCDESDPRIFLRGPFNYGEYTYFTDGTVMARIPKQKGHPELPDEKKENYHNAINRFFSSFNDTEFSPLPDVPEITKETCRECNGSGKYTKQTCPECDGYGEVEAETAYNTYDVPCKTCDEVGHINVTGDGQPCECCDGTGQAPKFNLESMRFDGGLISLKMAHRIKHLPNLRIGKSSTDFFGFKFDGGVGVIGAVQSPDSIALQEVINTKCQCGEPISIELNAPVTSRTDGKRPFYPGEKLSEGLDPTAYSARNITVFRCRKCEQPVSETVPEASYD